MGDRGEDGGVRPGRMWWLRGSGENVVGGVEVDGGVRGERGGYGA